MTDLDMVAYNEWNNNFSAQRSKEMPRSLRESIRRADQERPQREFENQKRIENEERDRARRLKTERKNEELSKKEEEGLLRGLFDKHLLPIFREVAAAKRVSLAEEEFGVARENLNPHFKVRTEEEYGKSKKIIGTLLWNYEIENRVIDRGIFRRKETYVHIESYRYLAMGITTKGVVSGPFDSVNINDADGVDKLWNSVEDFMVNDGGQTYQFHPDTGFDLGPP